MSFECYDLQCQEITDNKIRESVLTVNDSTESDCKPQHIDGTHSVTPDLCNKFVSIEILEYLVHVYQAGNMNDMRVIRCK